MPLLRISLDGSPLVAIPTDGREFVGARIGGTHDDPDYADVSAWGGTYASHQSPDHRIWLENKTLSVGNCVEIELLASGDEVGTGILFESNDASNPPLGHSHEEELLKLAAELRTQPNVRERYGAIYSSSKIPKMEFETLPGEYGFGLNVLWNSLHPERVSVSLYAYSIDSMERQEAGRDAVREKLDVGQKCRLAFVA
jgi:hypothetical protein